MPYKFRKAPIKRNRKTNGMRHPVHAIASRVLSRLRKKMFPQAKQPLCITISTKGLTPEQIELLKDMERKGLIPKITWIESSPNTIDDKMKYALLYLHGDEAELLSCKMRHGYDYAWIKMALDHGKIPSPYSKLKHMSTPAFVKYIKKLGFTDIAGSKTLNKFIAKASWYSDGNSITFPDVPVSISECERRNKISLKFLELINEI